MKYRYFYQTSGNEERGGEIEARDRSDAYAKLRKLGIRPYRLIGKNPPAWRRLAATWALAALAAALGAAVLLEAAAGRRAVFAAEDRAQVYGDPERLQELAADGWLAAMGGSEGDAWFARHARPAAPCGCVAEGGVAAAALDAKPLRISPDDTPELAKMKRLVNGMKREFAAYVGAGGSAEDYMALCDERIRTERGIFENVKRELKSLEPRLAGDGAEDAAAQWAKKNALLRSMGLPTVAMPDERE